METYYIIVGLDYKTVNTTKNDKQHTPITLYNYPFISKFTIDDNNNISEIDNIPLYYSSYSTLELTDNKWRVGLLRITTSHASKRVEHMELPTLLNNKVITYLLTNNRYKQYISTTTDITFDNIFRFLTSDYLIKYSPKHDYLYIQVDYTNDNKQIVLANVFGISKDLKHAYRVFPNVVLSTVYTLRKRMRENIKYNHTIAKELVYTLFDKLLTLSTSLLLQGVNNIEYNQFEIIDSLHAYVLLGEEHTM